MYFIPNSNSAWAIERARQADAARASHVRDKITTAIESDVFDGDAVDFLARREHYSSAARHLVALCEALDTINIVPAIHSGVLFRIAAEFRAIEVNRSRYRVPFVDLRFLSELGRSQRPRARAARVALAALGKPIGPWRELSQRERAAYLLGVVVRCHRDGAVP